MAGEQGEFVVVVENGRPCERAVVYDAKPLRDFLVIAGATQQVRVFRTHHGDGRQDTWSRALGVADDHQTMGGARRRDDLVIQEPSEPA